MASRMLSTVVAELSDSRHSSDMPRAQSEADGTQPGQHCAGCSIREPTGPTPYRACARGPCTCSTRVGSRMSVIGIYRTIMAAAYSHSISVVVSSVKGFPWRSEVGCWRNAIGIKPAYRSAPKTFDVVPAKFILKKCEAGCHQKNFDLKKIVLLEFLDGKFTHIGARMWAWADRAEREYWNYVGIRSRLGMLLSRYIEQIPTQSDRRSRHQQKLNKELNSSAS